MKKNKTIVKGILMIALLLPTLKMYAQTWQWNSPGGAGDQGTTTSTVTGVGVGDFITASTAIKGALHINTSLTSTNSGFNAGQVFRTSGPSGVDHQWRMFSDNNSSNTEKFNVTNPSGTDNVDLKAITGSLRFWADGTQRMCITPGSSSGFIGIGAGFNSPKSKVHIHQGGSGTDVQFQMTSDATGNSNATDGLGIKIIDNTKNVELKQYETADMLFYTTNSSPTTVERVRIKSTGDVGIGTSSPSARLDVVPTPGSSAGLTEGIAVTSNGNNYSTDVKGIDVTVSGAAAGGGNTDGITINATSVDVGVVGIDSRAYVSKAGTNPTYGSLGGYFLGGAGNSNGAATTMGVFGYSSGAYNNASGSNWGGYFWAQGATELNVGVRGEAGDGNINYGVYGTTYSNAGCTIGGSCANAAGYFNGNLVYTGAFGAVSDLKFKTNISPIDSATYFLNHIQPHSFIYDTANYPQMNLGAGKHYGVVAQELELILPELVNNYIQPEQKDSAGNIVHNAVDFKAVNYIELISILIAGYQSQQARIDSLVNVFGSTPKTGNHSNGNNNGNSEQKVSLSNSSEAILYQNQPNPFSSSTKINYFIPENSGKAEMSFYNATGVVMKSITISQKGQGTVEVDAASLTSAIYTYSLIIDGKVVDTKRMVKTK